MGKAFSEFLEAHTGPEHRDAAWTEFEALCRAVGVRFMTHIEVLPTDINPDRSIYRENKVPEWKARYLRKRYFMNDPAVRLALAHQRPFLFQRIWALSNDLFSPIERRICIEAHEFGFGDGIIAPFFGYRGAVKGSITLFAERGHAEAWQAMERHADELIRNALELHMWFSENPVGSPQRGTLTQRETECVRLLASGLYREQIAREMGIGIDRVNQLIASAKRRIDAKTGEELVVKSAETCNI